MLDALTGANMRLRDNGEPLLVSPEQRARIGHGDGDDGPRGADAQRQRDRCAQEDVAVARDDAARHAGDQDVDEARHELLVGLARGGDGGDGRGERVLEVEGARHAGVDGVFGGAGLVVEEEAAAADLGG